MESSKVSHNPWYIALLLYNVLTVGAAIVIYCFARLGLPGSDVFVSTQTAQYSQYPVDTTPSPWLFNTWFITFAWQVAWLLYNLCNLFRKTRSNEPLYTSPYLLRPSLLGVNVLASGCSLVWCFLFDRGHNVGALVTLVIMATLMVIAVVISHRSLERGWVTLVRQGREREAWVVRGLVLNGLALHATWLFLLALLHLAIVLHYVTGSDVSAVTSSTLALGVLAVGMGVWVVVDTCVVERYTRYTLTPYVVVVVSLVAMVTERGEVVDRNGILTLVLTGLGAVFLVVKVVWVVVQHLRDSCQQD